MMNSKQINVHLPTVKSTKPSYSKIYPSSGFALYFDGCSKGNPGPSGIGTVIYKDGEEYWSDCRYIGNNRTNNESEYSALILGLQIAIEKEIKTLSVCGDSLLVINQVNKIYKVKNPNLSVLYDEVVKLTKYFTYIDFNHVYRKDNKRADQLSNLALEYINNVSDTEIIDSIFEETKKCDEELVIEKLLNNQK